LPEKRVEPRPRDRENLAKRGLDLDPARVGEARHEGGMEARLVVAEHRDDERKSEPLAVIGIEAEKPVIFITAETQQPGARLLGDRVRGHLPASRGPAGKIGVRANKIESALRRGRPHRGNHRRVQGSDARERNSRPGRFRYPRRMLKNAAERGDEPVAVHPIEREDRRRRRHSRGLAI